MKTLEEILKYEKEHRCEDGDFGIKACKAAIKQELESNRIYNAMYRRDYPTNLYQLLEQYVKKANDNSIFFNRAMILACWELINEKENK